MKTNNKTTKTTKKANIAKTHFCWVFASNTFTQIHKEIDYRMYLDRNYISKSNQGL